MKNDSVEEQNSTVITLTQDDTVIQQKENKENGFHCPLNHLSTQLCFNEKCPNNAFICNSKQCQCQQKHSTCLSLDSQKLFNKIQSKIIPIQFLQDFIDTQIQALIDQLSKFQEDIKIWMKTQLQFLGLNKDQKQFLIDVKSNNVSQIKGSTIWKVIRPQQYQIPLNDFIAENLQMLEYQLKEIKTILNRNLDNIKEQIKAYNQRIIDSPKVFIENFINSQNKSNILTQIQEANIMKKFFFPRKITSANLLYRASENDFSALKFHQNCDGISDTLILIETEFGKKIGGYTPVEWETTDFIYVTDESMKTFLFSLTNGDKFKQTTKQHAVVHNSKYGPTFGGGHDLCIKDKANTTASSYARINFMYTNEKYELDDKQSWERFTGCGESKNFKVKQWEVWSLELI